MESQKYIGNVLRHERGRQGIKAEDVCSGICSLKVYNKLESGIYNANLHMKRALFQRLGLSAGKVGMYLGRNEYDEFYERLLILEAINEPKEGGNATSVESMLVGYEKKYAKDDIFNAQFSKYMHARIAELQGDTKESLRLYVAAAEYTMPGIREKCSDRAITACDMVKLPRCMSLDEFFIMADIARMYAAEEESSRRWAVCIYEELIRYCEKTDIEIWNLVCMYPKVLCELLAVQTPDMLGSYERKEMLERCNKALELLRQASRLHFVGSLIENKSLLTKLLGDEPDRHWDEFLVNYEYLRKRYRQTGNRFEWYPYYVDCDFYKVEKLIDERRIMHNMTMEELADGICTYETVSRIINRKVNPTLSVIQKMLNKLGLKGVLESQVVVSDSTEVHKLWDMLVDCKVMSDDTTGNKLFTQLTVGLDHSIEINRMVLDYEKAVLDTYKENINYAEMAERYGKILAFPIKDSDKYTCLTQIESMVVNRYFDNMDRIRDYGNIEVLKKIGDNFSKSELEKRRFASQYEGIEVRRANQFGNINEYDVSDGYADNGIMLEIECERAHVLPTLLYCISWNSGERGKKAENAVEFCKCAYEMAWYVRNFSKMKTYSRWLEKNT